MRVRGATMGTSPSARPVRRGSPRNIGESAAAVTAAARGQRATSAWRLANVRFCPPTGRPPGGRRLLRCCIASVSRGESPTAWKARAAWNSRQRRQFGGVGPFQQPAESVGRFRRVAVVEFGEAEAEERLGAGVGEVVAAGHFIQQGGVEVRLGQEDLGGRAVLGAVGGQPLFGKRAEQVLGLGPAAGVAERDLAVRPLDLLLEEEIRLDVEAGLKDFGDGDPVAVVAPWRP